MATTGVWITLIWRPRSGDITKFVTESPYNNHQQHSIVLHRIGGTRRPMGHYDGFTLCLTKFSKEEPRGRVEEVKCVV